MRLRDLLVRFFAAALIGVFATAASVCCAQAQPIAPHHEAGSLADHDPPGHDPLGHVHSSKQLCVSLCGVLSTAPSDSRPESVQSVRAPLLDMDLALNAGSAPATPPPRR